MNILDDDEAIAALRLLVAKGYSFDQIGQAMLAMDQPQSE